MKIHFQVRHVGKVLKHKILIASITNNIHKIMVIHI